MSTEKKPPSVTSPPEDREVRAADLVQKGAPPEVAAAVWMLSAKQVDVLRRMSPTLSARHEYNLIALVAHAAQRDWRAAAWLLERQHPERWARPNPLDELKRLMGSPDKALAWMREMVPRLEAAVESERSSSGAGDRALGPAVKSAERQK
jgi:hypothetical protein